MSSSSSSSAASISSSQPNPAPESKNPPSSLLRNFGISAHIDSGKTTLTERILFYTGRINKMHEVRGKDGVGAVMDSMDLERERGITIQSAATHTGWGKYSFNIIDTPGHVDFTIEVERALRVLDGAIMVLCGVAGVQAQSITVDRQMKRYNIPRIAFVNKLDRAGANPERALQAMREKLRLNVASVQIPIGLEDRYEGLIDIVTMETIRFSGNHGETVTRLPEIPEDYKNVAAKKRRNLIECLAEVDEQIGELFLMEQDPTTEELKAAIRRATLGLKFVPLFCGSAYKNKGVQPLLDGIIDYLPSPAETKNTALNASKKEEPIPLSGDSKDPLVALAFKLDEGKYGQLTYMRLYQGSLYRGMFIRNVATGKRVKVPRLVRMHANEMEDVNEINSGEICAVFGIDCTTGDTFTDAETKDFNPTMLSMFVPDPVMSLAVSPTDAIKGGEKFSKALSRFTKEDPTLRVHIDPESKQTIISGMGELHLEIYVERMKREYSVETVTGAPKVNYRETITSRAEFNYLHKKQSGGSGQFGRVVGYMEPLTGAGTEAADLGVVSSKGRQEKGKKGDSGDEEKEESKHFIFENQILGNAIPPEYILAIKKGFEEAILKGDLIGAPVTGVRVCLTDGQAHAVDSSELAFKIAAKGAFLEGFRAARPVLLEPIMEVVVDSPDEYQGDVVGSLNKRRGIIQDTTMRDGYSYITAEVPLAEMFGYATDLRSATQAKATFNMTYLKHSQMNPNDQEKVIKERSKKAGADEEKGSNNNAKGKGRK